MNIVDVHKQTCQCLLVLARGQAELARCLDGVDSVTTRVGQPNDLGLAVLGTQQE